MVPARVTRRVDSLAAELFAPLLGAQPPGSRWRVVGWDAEQGLALSLARDERVLLLELERRDASRPCHARTARFNVCVRPAFGDGELSPEEQRLVAGVIAVLRRQEVRLPVFPPRPPPRERTVVRELEVGRVLVPEGRGQYYLNPYVGCAIGCAFCYVAERADFSRELEGLAPQRWGRFVDVKVNAPAVLRREVRAQVPGPVRLSPILTDPYQPLEARYRITRACLEVLLDAGFAPVVLTRAARVVDDLDLFVRFPRVAVGLSIPTDDDGIRRCFEPAADPIDARLDALARLRAAGVVTFAVVQPVLPMDPVRLAALLGPRVGMVRVDRMYDPVPVAHLYAAAGAPEAATEDFYQRTAAVLREALRARGVVLHEFEDLGAVLPR